MSKTHIEITVRLTPLEFKAMSQSFTQHVFERDDQVKRARRHGQDKFWRAVVRKRLQETTGREGE